MSSRGGDMDAHLPAGNGSAGSLLQDTLQPLLLEMLAGVRRHRETTLLAGFDSQGIAAAALQGLSFWDPLAVLARFRTAESLNLAFRHVVAVTLGDQSVRRIPADDFLGFGQGDGAPAGDPAGALITHWLAVWLEQFCLLMSGIHPRAVEVLMLRLEGCDSRRIADHLGLSLRLVKRVISDIHAACECVGIEQRRE